MMMKVFRRLGFVLCIALTASPASAIVAASNLSDAYVRSSVTPTGSGGYEYFVGTPVFAFQANVVDFYLPYFSDMGITNIVVPDSWKSAIEANNDLFHVGGGVLHFSTDAREPFWQDGIPAFSFESSFNAIKGPYASSLFDLATQDTYLIFGDPLIPGSPMALAAFPAAVPEPSMPALLLGGLGLLGWLSVRRKDRSAG